MVPDPTREAVAPWAWNPGRRLIRSIRLYAKGVKVGGAFGAALKRFAIIEHTFWSSVTSSDVPLVLEIGVGLLLPHPVGIVIHPNVKIGPNCLIFQQVTLGTRGAQEGVPVIGGHVDIGAGAKILGGVTIGNHARIGANAVVLTDVPAGAAAVGVPARIRPRKAGDQ